MNFFIKKNKINKNHFKFRWDDSKKKQHLKKQQFLLRPFRIYLF